MIVPELLGLAEQLPEAPPGLRGCRCRTSRGASAPPPAPQRAVPQVMFTDPEVTTVGLSAADAQQAGYRARVVDIAVAAIHAQDYTGWAQMVVDQNRHVIVGMTITCRTSQTCCTQR